MTNTNTATLIGIDPSHYVQTEATRAVRRRAGLKLAQLITSRAAIYFITNYTPQIWDIMESPPATEESLLEAESSSLAH